MKKKIAIILVLAMIAGCLAACGKQASEPGTDGDGKEIKIGALYPTQSISFCQEIRRGVEEAAAEFGFKTVECVYDLDADKGVEMMRNLIVQQVDAIVLHSVYSDAFAAPTQEAMDAGIPVITVDGMVNTEVTTFVASDNTQGGNLAGEFVGKYLEGKGNVLIITSEPGYVTMVERNDGFHAGLAGYPDIKITEVMDDGLSGMEGMPTLSRTRSMQTPTTILSLQITLIVLMACFPYWRCILINMATSRSAAMMLMMICLR